MAFQVSPGVNVTEIDKTERVSPVVTSAAVIAAGFKWGPVDKITTVTSERELVSTYGKPDGDTAANWLTASSFLAYGGSLQVIRTVGTDAANGHTNTDNEATVNLIRNEDEYDAGATLGNGAFVARYPGALGNSLQIGVFHDGTFADWKRNYIQNGISTSIDYSSLFDRAPGTSNYVLTRNGVVSIGDEIHIVVVDRTGDISGIPGTILEKYAHVSLASDAKDENGNSNYHRDVIRNNSKYIYSTGNWSDGGETIDTEWDAITSTTTDNVVDISTPLDLDIELGAAGNNNSYGNGDAARYTADQKGYGLLRDTDTTDVGIVISGDASSTLQGQLISDVAEYRKDAIAVISPERGDAKTAVISTGTNSTKAAALVTWANALTSSSYGVADSGYKRMYDAYNDVYRDVPLNGDIAGLMVRTENNQDAWWSPAGFTRGQIKNVVKLHFNPDKAARDSIYKAGVNPVVSMPGQGTLLYGDKTLLSKPSAFDRINVRRLFVVLEKSISRAARNLLFEFNYEFTRASFKNMVEPFLRNIKARRGVYDYLVICDSTNNTSEVIDRNEFVGDIFIKPARSINFIQLNFVAVRSGVEFSEVVGSV